MFSRGRNKLSVLFSILIITIFSCGRKTSEKEDYFGTIRHIDKPLDSITNLVYKNLRDTLNRWANLKLRYWYYLNDPRECVWVIDDLIYFNSQQNKCLATLLLATYYNKESDDIRFLLGEKQNGKWWFYDGPNLVIIQSVYEPDPTVKALPFSTLRTIARRTALSWYYQEKPAGTCLKKLFSEGYESYKKCSEEKYVINDEYFETNFNLDADRKDYPNFLKRKFQPDTTALNQ